MAEKKYKLRFDMSDGSTKEAEFSVPTYAARPQDYGAKGDGATDDTASFQRALAANRVVHVPGGEYKLSGELVIGNNCCLELSQDTVLNFTQTSGNCISLKMLSYIKGNHASVKVPYGFTGNVIYSSTALITDLYDIPGFKHWDPQWKPGRYITDLNILKPDTNGLHYSKDGTCNGNGIYLHANGNDSPSNFMMAVDFSGLRIAGAFTYGIRSVVENAVGDSGFNFDMRLDGFIEACETGVLLDGNINPVMSVVVQPQKSQPVNGTRKPYAKVGIKLVNTINANLMNTSVWDWDSDKTLWSEGGENQHLVMLGDCRGAILNERYYWSNPNYDIRSLIYTDTPSNLEKLVIINEPFTRWFKPDDMEPYFDNGETVRRLALKEELDEIAPVDKLPNFTNVLPTAIDKSGAIFQGTGFARYGMRWGSGNGTLITNEPYYGCTGLIPVKSGDRVYLDGIKLIYSSSDTTPNVVLFKSDFSYAHHATAGNIKGATWYFGYEETEEGFIVDLKAPLFTELSAAYVAFSFSRNAIGAKPMISINEPISYTISGVLADGIKVKGENVIGLPGGGSGSGGTGGAQPDLNAAPGEPGHVLHRTHYTEIVEGEILPETTVEINPDEGAGVLLWPVLELEVGEEYTVTWNGVEYKTVGVDGAALGEGGVVLGNFGQLTGEGDTGEPFVLMAAPPEMVADIGFAIMVAPLDGSASATVSIYGKTKIIHKLDSKYLPEGYPHVSVTQGEAMGDTRYSVDEESGTAFLNNTPKIITGGEYTVTWRNTEYVCVALDGAAIGQTGGVVLGNVGALTGGNVTDEPFVIAIPPADSEMAAMGVGVIVVPLDGSTTGWVRIDGPVPTYTPIIREFLPPIRGLNAYIIDLDQKTTTLNANVIMNMDVAELQACTTVIYNGKAYSNAGFSMVVESANGLTGATILGVLAYEAPYFGLCYIRFRVNAAIGYPASVQQRETYQAVPQISGDYARTPMALVIPAGSYYPSWYPLEALMLDQLMFRTGSNYYALSIDENGNVITQRVNASGEPV